MRSIAGRSFDIRISNFENKMTPTVTDAIGHIYVHIPFCARICPYCAFYKELLDRRQTDRFCGAILRELEAEQRHRQVIPTTIYFGGGTPTALTISQLRYLLEGFRDRLDLVGLVERSEEHTSDTPQNP